MAKNKKSDVAAKAAFIKVLESKGYRAEVKSAPADIVATRDGETMSYEKEAGTGKTTTASLLIQERKADGSVLRREEYLLFGKAVPREELHRGMEQLTYYYTDEGYTAVFTTREKIRAVRAPGGLPKSIIPKDATFSGQDQTSDGHACWVIRAKGEAIGNVPYPRIHCGQRKPCHSRLPDF